MKFLLIFVVLKIYYEADIVKVIPQGEFEVIVAKGNINLTDKKTTIKGDSATIFKTQEIDSGFISGNVFIIGENIKISCQKAKYNFLKEYAEFFEDVRVETQEEFISADYIFYSSKKDSSYAKGNVLIEKKKEGLRIFCGEAEYNFKTERGELRSIQKVELESDGKKIEMIGEKIKIFSDTLYLTGNVEIRGDKEKAKGDTLVYFQKEEVAHLVGKPLFSFEKGNARGEKIILKFKNRKIKKAILEKNSELRILTEKEEEIIINTSIVHAFFDKDGKIKKLEGFEGAKGFILLNKVKKR